MGAQNDRAPDEQPNQFVAIGDVPDTSVNSLRLFLAAGTNDRVASLPLPLQPAARGTMTAPAECQSSRSRCFGSLCLTSAHWSHSRVADNIRRDSSNHFAGEFDAHYQRSYSSHRRPDCGHPDPADATMAGLLTLQGSDGRGDNRALNPERRPHAVSQRATAALVQSPVTRLVIQSLASRVAFAGRPGRCDR